MKQLQSVEIPLDQEIETDIIEILRELLQPYSTLLVCNLSKKPLDQRSVCVSLKFDVDKNHLNPTKLHKLTSIGDVDVQLAAKLTESYLLKAYEYLDELQSILRLCSFTRSF